MDKRCKAVASGRVVVTDKVEIDAQLPIVTADGPAFPESNVATSSPPRSNPSNGQPDRRTRNQEGGTRDTCGARIRGLELAARPHASLGLYKPGQHTPYSETTGRLVSGA
ncbi:Aste57867_23617 [Aphanomyces stellatus]|uniref:Aste57867_23617 protein n=1 Tax=Aphanomyces stellatus TaxID=120398 RepID=A0A485LP87_9STRA|nr:hypothetical protein As57867_023545 [Aphanomyces stellatus]VFU00262.1 Aste57867_23617 [Aphanomyces stellatus]